MEAHAATRIGVASSCADIPHTKNTGFDKKMKGATPNQTQKPRKREKDNPHITRNPRPRKPEKLEMIW